MKKIEVFDGNELSENPILYPTQNPRCAQHSGGSLS